ncbi:MAG: hypothetical protein ABFE01_16325 [Phycisphaerales bacterium]
MKNMKPTIVALILTVRALAVPAAAQEGATPPENAKSISASRTANCLLKIVTETSVISLSDSTIPYLIQGSDVRGNAIERTLGPAPEAGKTRIRTKVLEVTEIEGPPKERSIILAIDLDLAQGAKPAADELMDALVDNFRNALERIYQNERSRMDDQIRLSDREVSYADEMLKMAQQKLTELSDRDLSSEALRSNIADITAQLQGLQLEKASQEAYREGVVKQISEIQAQVEKTVANDVIANELKQVIERRMVELKNTQQKIDAGVVPSGELAGVEDKLATARIDLARRQEELSKTGIAAGLGQLTAELTTLTLERDRNQAKGEQLLSQLDEARSSLGRSAEYERVKLKLDVAKQNLTEAETLLNKAGQRARMLSVPSVSVIGD